MSPAGDRDGLSAIEQELLDGDPALAEAFQRWEVPTGGREEQPVGTTTAPPWVVAVFAVAAVSWVVSPGFGVLVGAVGLAWVLLNANDDHRHRPGSRDAPGRAEKAPNADGRDDGWPPPNLWRGGWM
jgi:hypothetical protein